MDSFTLLLLFCIAIAVTALFLRRWRYYPFGFANPEVGIKISATNV